MATGNVKKRKPTRKGARKSKPPPGTVAVYISKRKYEWIRAAVLDENGRRHPKGHVFLPPVRARVDLKAKARALDESLGARLKATLMLKAQEDSSPCQMQLSAHVDTAYVTLDWSCSDYDCRYPLVCREGWVASGGGKATGTCECR